jgi:cell division transport system permease protein
MKTGALALDRDPSSRFLPWIMAALSLVVAVAIGVAFSLASLTASWGDIGNDRVTVRFAQMDAQVEQVAMRAAEHLSALPKVRSAELLAVADVQQLLSPWLGKSESAAALPLPWIIDIHLSDPAALRQVEAEAAAFPGAVLDSTRGWLEPLRQLAGLSGLVAGILAGLAVVVIALVTVFSARAALTAHAPTIELLRLMGAAEGFIAQRFQFHSMRQGLIGGLAGSVPGIAVVALGVGAARLDGSDLLSGLTPTAAGWVAMALLPPLIALVAMLTARYTVLEMLRNRW